MGRIGKISSIKKEYNRNNGSLEASLAANGYSRFPNTAVRLVPAKEPNGLDYKTGLNVNSPSVLALKETNPELYESEVKRISQKKAELEEKAGISLDPRSPFYTNIFNDQVTVKVTQAKLIEGDNCFNLENVFEAITYEWLRVHPLVASSYAAYQRGEYPSNTQFYVNDENIEEELKYKKKVALNTAISTLDSMSLEKRKKVARLLGLPVSDNNKEHIVYNLLDSFIKNTDTKEGNPVDLFNKLAGLNDKLLSTKDIVDQAIKHSIYRITKGGRITEGGVEVAKDKADLVDFLMEDKNQDDMLALQEKLKNKKAVN